jgi:hypothetical protein
MACKFLEISSGQNLPPMKFKIVEVQNDTFMLKTKDSHIGLLGTLDSWLKNNYLMDASSYSVMLWERSSTMRPVPSERMTPELNVY